MARKLNVTLPLFEASDKPTSELVLRPYQDRTVRLVRMHHVQNKKRILVVAPTRAGKTVIITAITKSSKLPVIFVAHRMELIDQCVNQLSRAGLTNVGVLRGDDERENPNAAVQVCSIATLARREKPFQGQRVLIFIDEAHRSASESYRTHIFEAYPDATIIGFTATPSRLDGKPLGDLYEVLEVACTYQELMKRPDWLVAPDVYAAPVRADLSKVRTIAGDFEEGALAEVMHQKDLEGNIVSHWLRLAGAHPVFDERGNRQPAVFRQGERRKTFLFATSIEHSLSLCGRFEKESVRVAHVDGNTPEDHRRAALRDLAKGELDIISNVNILLEGVDVPEAKCAVHARPTQSLVLWRQSACRILTPYKGIIPLLLDHAGNFDRLGAPHEDLVWSLTSKPVRKPASMRVCPTCYAYVVLGRMMCPYCGNEFPASARGEGSLPGETPEELARRNTEPDVLKREFFNKMVEMARQKGFKPGFAAAKYKDRYKDWPPHDWTQIANWEFAKDENWQRLLESRTARRAAEEQAKAEAEAREIEAVREGDRTIACDENDVGMLPPEDPFVQDDDSFGSWLEGEGIHVHKHEEPQ